MVRLRVAADDGFAQLEKFMDTTAATFDSKFGIVNAQDVDKLLAELDDIEVTKLGPETNDEQ